MELYTKHQYQYSIWLMNTHLQSRLDPYRGTTGCRSRFDCVGYRVSGSRFDLLLSCARKVRKLIFSF